MNNFLSKLVGYEKLIPILKQMLEEMPEKRLDFNQLEFLLEQVMKDIHVEKPKDELDYYEKWIQIQEEKQEKTIKGSIEIYNHHMSFFEIYDKITCLKNAKYHLEKACECVKKMKSKFDKIGNLINLEKEEIESLYKLGDLYRQMFC